MEFELDTVTHQEFSAWLKDALLRDGGSDDVTRFRRGLESMKRRRAITHVDDLGRFFFTGGYASRAKDHKNPALTSDVLMATFAHWVQRPSAWVSHPGSVVRSPSNSLLQGLSELVDAADKNSVTVIGVINTLRGAIASGYRDWAEADRQFRVAPFPEPVQQSSVYLGSRTFVNPYWAVDLAAPRPVAGNFLSYDAHLRETIPGLGSRPVVVFSCDTGYFDRFAFQAVQSIAELGLEVDVVIAIVRPLSTDPPTTSAHADELDSLLGAGRVFVVEAKTRNELRPMSALARFIVAADLHRLLDAPLFIMDIDVRFQQDSVRMARELLAADRLSFSFNVFGNAILPWIRVAAGATFVPAGPIGNAFFDVYLGYIARALRPDSNWWIDQNALNAALVRVRESFPTEPIGTTHPFLASTLKDNRNDDVRGFKSTHAASHRR